MKHVPRKMEMSSELLETRYKMRSLTVTANSITKQNHLIGSIKLEHDNLLFHWAGCILEEIEGDCFSTYLLSMNKCTDPWPLMGTEIDSVLAETGAFLNSVSQYWIIDVMEMIMAIMDKNPYYYFDVSDGMYGSHAKVDKKFWNAYEKVL